MGADPWVAALAPRRGVRPAGNAASVAAQRRASVPERRSAS